MFDLAAIGPPQTDNSEHFTSLDEGDIEKSRRFRGEGDHTQFAILKTLVNPDQSCIPVEFARKSQRDTVLCLICQIFVWIKLNLRLLL